MQETAQTRDRILDAALDVFTERGFHQATVAEVAKQAHVGKGTVYLYFAGKEALLVAIFDTLIDRLLCTLDQTLSEHADPRQVVHQWVSRQLAERRAGRLIPMLLAQHPFLSTLSLQRERGDLLRRAVEQVAARIRAAIDRGTLRPVDPTLAACLVLCLPAAAPLYRAARPDASLVEAIPDIAREMTDMLWSGLRKERER